VVQIVSKPCINTDISSEAGSHNGHYEEYFLLVCTAVYFRKSPTFRKNLSPPFSGSNSKSSKDLLAACFSLGSLFDSEQGGDTFLRNIGLFPNYSGTNRRQFCRYIFTLKLYKLQPSLTIETRGSTHNNSTPRGHNIPAEWPAVGWGDTTQF
jgi:hypothetical protein